MPSSALQLWGGPGPDFAIPAKLAAFARVVGGNDAHTLLLLHCDGDDGSVTFVDSSLGGSPKTILANGSARVRPTSKFGDGGLYCDGSGAYLQVQPSADFYFAGDFTIDFWANVTRDSSRPFLFTFWGGVDDYLAIEGRYTRGNQASFVLRFVSGRRIEFVVETDYVDCVGQWNHFAICRSGSTVRLFIGGAEIGSATFSGAVNLTSHSLYVGRSLRYGLPDLQALDGHVDEFRITNDARFPSAFTPYSNEYTMQFSTDATGRSIVYGSFVLEGRGRAGVVKATFSADGRGSARIFNSLSCDGRGQAAIVKTFSVDGRGKCGVIGLPVQTFKTDGSGVAKVYRTFSADGRGQSRTLVPYAGEGRGNARIVRDFVVDGRGNAKVFRSYTADGRGIHRVLGTPIYQVFYGNGSPPDLAGAPWQTFTVLPFATPAISGVGKHYFVVRRWNLWGLQTQNDQTTIIELDGAGNQLQPRPSGAHYWTFIVAPVPKVSVVASYAYPIEGTNQADQWLVYAKVGSAPVIGVDAPVVVPMLKSDGVAKLRWLSGDYSIGNAIHVKVLTRRTTGTARDSDDVAAKVNTIISAASVAAGGIGVFQSGSRGFVQEG